MQTGTATTATTDEAQVRTERKDRLAEVVDTLMEKAALGSCTDATRMAFRKIVKKQEELKQVQERNKHTQSHAEVRAAADESLRRMTMQAVADVLKDWPADLIDAYERAPSISNDAYLKGPVYALGATIERVRQQITDDHKHAKKACEKQAVRDMGKLQNEIQGKHRRNIKDIDSQLEDLTCDMNKAVSVVQRDAKDALTKQLKKVRTPFSERIKALTEEKDRLIQQTHIDKKAINDSREQALNTLDKIQEEMLAKLRCM